MRVTQNGLTTLGDRLPAGLLELHANANKLEALPANLPRTLVVIAAPDNRLLGFPADLPVTLQRPRPEWKSTEAVARYDHRPLTSCEISIERTLIPISSIPIIPPAGPGPRIHFSLPANPAGNGVSLFGQAGQVLNASATQSKSVAAAVRPWLAKESEPEMRWDGISIALKQENHPRVSSFAGSWIGCVIPSCIGTTMRAKVLEWLVELSRPERAGLREDAFAICTGSTETRDDRVVSMRNQP